MTMKRRGSELSRESNLSTSGACTRVETKSVSRSSSTFLDDCEAEKEGAECYTQEREEISRISLFLRIVAPFDPVRSDPFISEMKATESSRNSRVIPCLTLLSFFVFFFSLPLWFFSSLSIIRLFSLYFWMEYDPGYVQLYRLAWFSFDSLFFFLILCLFLIFPLEKTKLKRRLTQLNHCTIVFYKAKTV